MKFPERGRNRVLAAPVGQPPFCQGNGSSRYGKLSENTTKQGARDNEEAGTDFAGVNT